MFKQTQDVLPLVGFAGTAMWNVWVSNIHSVSLSKWAAVFPLLPRKLTVKSLSSNLTVNILQ